MTIRRSVRLLVACAAVAACLGLPLPARAAPAARPCATPLNRQFDFWIGRWRVTDAATKKFDGTNDVTRELGGCVLQEHWKGAEGSAGTSFNLYDASRKRWHQTWVDGAG